MDRCSLCDETGRIILCTDGYKYCPSCLIGIRKTNPEITPSNLVIIKNKENDQRNIIKNARGIFNNDPFEEVTE